MPAPTVSYLEEVRTMMYAAGDCRRPLVESAAIVEEIVYRQMISFIHRAQTACEVRGAQYFDGEDVIYVLRLSPTLLCRIIQKLKAKDYSAQTSKADDEDDLAVDAGVGEEAEEDEPLSLGTVVDGRRVKFCKKVLDKIDPTGQLVEIAFNDALDSGKKDRLTRVSAYAAEMDAGEYVRFSEARQVSFTKSFINAAAGKPAGGCASVRKFRDWLFGSDPFFGPDSDHRPAPMTMEILNILAHEILATVMDCAFMVKREATAAGFGPRRGQTESGSDASGVTAPKLSPLYATSASQQMALLLSQKLRSKPENRDVRLGLDRFINDAVQPWEIREAVRRLRFAHGNSPHTLFENADESEVDRVIF